MLLCIDLTLRLEWGRVKIEGAVGHVKMHGSARKTYRTNDSGRSELRFGEAMGMACRLRTFGHRGREWRFDAFSPLC
jgi:hypothetical protein